MEQNWRVQQAIMESLNGGDVQVAVQWNNPKSYTARLMNFDDFVRLKEAVPPAAPLVGEGTTAAQAIEALFNTVSGKLLEIAESRTSQKRTWVFTPKGYVPV